MKIQVVVKAGAKKDEIVPLGDGKFRISVKERAIEGRANESVREVLAEYFKVSRSQVLFLQGLKNKIKRIEIANGL